jgi:hypothetical protein
MRVTRQSSSDAGQDTAKERLRQGRDAVSVYLEARGLAGLTLPCEIDYYRTILGDSNSRGVRQARLLFKAARLLLAQGWAAFRHVPAAAGLSLKQALTKTAIQTLSTTPVTLAAMILLFLTSDAWQICGNEHLAQVIVILGVVLIFSVLFFFASSGKEFGCWTSDIIPNPAADDIKALAESTTPGAVKLANLEIDTDSAQLGRLGLANVRIIYVVLVAGNFLAVGFWAMLALFFFGLLIFNEATQARLLGVKKVHALAAGSIVGYPVAVTWQLILVCLMLSGVAVLSFAATGLQDQRARDAFVKPNVDDLKACISAFYFFRAAVRVVGPGDRRAARHVRGVLPGVGGTGAG